MKRAGFTLVEMLIVMVIIWILSSALLPKLTGYMARTRDLKRQADLRNVAAAIEMYRGGIGEWPLLDKNPHYNVWSASKWGELLAPYLTAIPQDPSKRTVVDVWLEEPYNHRGDRLSYLKDWEYLIQYGTRDYKPITTPDFALLVAKVESPEAANYLIFNYDATSQYHKPGNAWYYANSNSTATNQFNTIWDREWRENRAFVGCDEMKKADTPKIIDQDGKRICEYSSADQLYYIVMIK